ncbi:hypothetical protein ABIB66_001276 [Bradyrhizobium sp. F1.13.3]
MLIIEALATNESKLHEARRGEPGQLGQVGDGTVGAVHDALEIESEVAAEL